MNKTERIVKVLDILRKERAKTMLGRFFENLGKGCGIKPHELK